ncbi:MAG: ATP synthase F0 subunit B [Chloroflexi bacterium]|nr:ATP synthase F0 subunit B [Chloroflexota bacterium]
MRLPGGRLIIDQAELNNVIEQLRMVVPNEVKEARSLLAQRNELLDKAQASSSEIMRLAQYRAEKTLDDSTVVRQAQEQADKILRDAREDAVAIVNGADDYAEESLRQLAGSITQLNAVVQNGLHALASRRTKRAQKPATVSVLDRPRPEPAGEGIKLTRDSQSG